MEREDALSNIFVHSILFPLAYETTPNSLWFSMSCSLSSHSESVFTVLYFLSKVRFCSSMTPVHSLIWICLGLSIFLPTEILSIISLHLCLGIQYIIMNKGINIQMYNTIKIECVSFTETYQVYQLHMLMNIFKVVNTLKLYRGIQLV